LFIVNLCSVMSSQTPNIFCTVFAFIAILCQALHIYMAGKSVVFCWVCVPIDFSRNESTHYAAIVATLYCGLISDWVLDSDVPACHHIKEF